MSQKTPCGRVRKVYFGKGERARREAQRLADRKAQQEADKRAIQAEQMKASDAEQSTSRLEDLTKLLLEATLLAAGYWRGRDYRQWRRRRGIHE